MKETMHQEAQDETQQDEHELVALDAAGRLEWAVRNFAPHAVATSSFGADSAVLLHLIAQHAPGLPVYFINTGFLFGETLSYRQRLEDRLGISIIELRPKHSRAEFLAREGALYRTDPDRCCRVNKVEVLQEALRDTACWISGLRGDRSNDRADTRVLEMRGNGLYKLHPIFDWSRSRVETYLEDHDLPRNPLAGQGFTSIGCEPCTAKPLEGRDDRSGRWVGHQKVECGIHDLFQ